MVHQQLETFAGLSARRRDVFNDRVEERLHRAAGVVELFLGVTALGAGVDDREIQLLIGRVQGLEQLKDRVRTLCGVALLRSILLMTTMGLAPASSALRSTKRVWACGPSTESTTRSTPSIMFMIRSTSPPKSAWPGVSTMLM